MNSQTTAQAVFFRNTTDNHQTTPVCESQQCPILIERDIAALRSHVIDGIEDVKQSAENTAQGIWHLATLQKWTVVGVWVISILVAAHVIHHW